MNSAIGTGGKLGVLFFPFPWTLFILMLLRSLFLGVQNDINIRKEAQI